MIHCIGVCEAVQQGRNEKEDMDHQKEYRWKQRKRKRVKRRKRRRLIADSDGCKGASLRSSTEGSIKRRRRKRVKVALVID